jgi:hypothetical protein
VATIRSEYPELLNWDFYNQIQPFTTGM